MKKLLAIPASLLAIYIFGWLPYQAMTGSLPAETRELPASPATLLAVFPVLPATGTDLPAEFYEITITAFYLNIRLAPDGSIAGKVLANGDVLLAICDGKWCELENGGFVWRGCTSDNPGKLGCEER